MKQEISNSTLKTLVKTIKHFFSELLKGVKQLKDPSKT